MGLNQRTQESFCSLQETCFGGNFDDATVRLEIRLETEMGFGPVEELESGFRGVSSLAEDMEEQRRCECRSRELGFDVAEMSVPVASL